MATTAEPTTQLDTSFHDRRLERRLEDPEFREEFERSKRELAAIDAIVNALDDLRAQRGLTKAGLARAIGKAPASIRRLLTAHGNPRLRTIVAAADAIDADVRIVPRKRRSRTQGHRAAAGPTESVPVTHSEPVAS